MSADNDNGVFSLSLDRICEIDIDALISDAHPPGCSEFADAFASVLSKMKADSAEPELIAIIQCLYETCRLWPRFDEPTQPYRPGILWQGRRSLSLTDLSRADAAAFRALAQRTNHPLLKARLLDLVWETARDHVVCREAAALYLDSAALLLASDKLNALEHYRRGVYLSGRLGLKNEPFQRAQAALASATKAELLVGGGIACRFLELALEVGTVDPSEFGDLSKIQGDAVREKGDLELARQFYDVARGFYRRARREADVKACGIAIARSLVAEAERHVSSHGKGSLLVRAIEEFRASGDRASVLEHRKMLAEVQYNSTLEMATIVSPPVDLAKEAEAMREHVRGKTLFGAIARLAFGVALTDLGRLRQSVLDEVDKFAFSHSFGRVYKDEQGRVVRTTPAMLGLEGAEREAAIEQQMFRNAAQFEWSLRCVGFICAGQTEICNEYRPLPRDLFPLVAENAFIPPGHEEIFLRGLLAGFYGDFLVASHLLVPQIENSLRFVLECQGVNVSNLMGDGTQPVKVLGAILGMEEMKTLLGEQLSFELRGCLIEKSGFDFRNRLAHGFLSQDEATSLASITVWWLVLRLCCHGSQVFRPSPSGPADEEPGEGNAAAPSA